MAIRIHKDACTRDRMIGKLEEGWDLKSVHQKFGNETSIVSRAWKAFQRTDTDIRKVGRGLSRKTTASDDRYITV